MVWVMRRFPWRDCLGTSGRWRRTYVDEEFLQKKSSRQLTTSFTFLDGFSKGKLIPYFPRRTRWLGRWWCKLDLPWVIVIMNEVKRVRVLKKKWFDYCGMDDIALIPGKMFCRLGQRIDFSMTCSTLFDSIVHEELLKKIKVKCTQHH